MARVVELEQLLQRLLAQIYELEQTLANFNPPTSQALLQERLQDFMAGVQKLRDLAPQYQALELPLDLLRWVDEGGHPDEYVKKLFEDARRDNQLVKGRVAAVQQLRDKLLEGVQRDFAAEAEAYSQALCRNRRPGGDL